MTQDEGLHIAQAFQEVLQRKGIPVLRVFLFGSVAKGTAHPQSDVDIAVVCTPFRQSRLEENVECSKARWDLDLRIETVCLHPEDFNDPYFTLAREVERHGILVHPTVHPTSS